MFNENRKTMLNSTIPSSTAIADFLLTKNEINLIANAQIDRLLSFKLMTINKQNEFFLLDPSIKIKGKTKTEVNNLKIRLDELESNYYHCQSLLSTDNEVIKSDKNAHRTYLSKIRLMKLWYSPLTSKFKPHPFINSYVEAILTNAYKFLSKTDFESNLDSFEGATCFGLYRIAISDDKVKLFDSEIDEMFNFDSSLINQLPNKQEIKSTSNIKFENSNNDVISIINHLDKYDIQSLKEINGANKETYRDKITLGIIMAYTEVVSWSEKFSKKILKNIQKDFASGITYSDDEEYKYIADRATYMLVSSGNKTYFGDALDILIRTELESFTNSKHFTDGLE